MKESEQLVKIFLEAGDILRRNLDKGKRADFRQKIWSHFWVCYRATWQ